ncbi:MAG TPA: hypothetical protein VHA56_09185 [Mucilaginibacter sp.]|nr:hypothetical protein [Mucilaginibacter sp.]
MAPLRTISLILLSVYLLIIVFFLILGKGKKTVESFAIGNREISFWGTLAALVASFRDGAGLAVWVSLTFFFGFGSLWLTLGMSIALLLFVFIVNVVKNNSTKFRFITTSDLLQNGIGEKTSLISAIIIAFTALLYSASQLFVAGNILSILLGIQENIGILITSIIIGTYLILGGYKIVIKTDLLQWGIIMTIVILPFLMASKLNFHTTFNNAIPEFIELGWQNKLGFAGISFLVVLAGGDVWQRIFSARNKSVARKAFLLTIPLYFIVCIGIVLLGLTIKTILPTVEPQKAFFSLFSVNSIKPIVLAFVGIFTVAALSSTLDTQSFLFATTLTKNVIKKIDEKRFVKTTSYFIVVLFLFLSLIAFSIKNIVTFLFGAVTLETILVPSYLLVVFFPTDVVKKHDFKICVTLGISTAFYAYLFISGAFNNILNTVLPFCLEFVLLLAIWLYSKILTKKL